MISDLLITGTITYYLLTAKTGWLHTDSLITKIIMWVDLPESRER